MDLLTSTSRAVIVERDSQISPLLSFAIPTSNYDEYDLSFLTDCKHLP